MSKYKREYRKAYYQKHKEEEKAYRESHKDYYKNYHKNYRESHKDKYNNYQKDYRKADVNSFGKTKNSIRRLSNYYLQKHGTKIPGYEIHHCFTYDDPKKFIYCPIKLHIEIHKFLDEKGIDADTDHYEQIKHLLDDTVVVYGV